jgi:NADPH:quinone reductase
MYAMVVHELGGPAALVREERAPAAPGPSEVALTVEAIGCNFFDILITQGKYQRRPELPFAPGGEAVGRVRALGEGVAGMKVGDRVLALADYGTYASDLVVRADRAFVLPDAIPADEGVALGVVYQTAHVALVERARLAAGETLLVHAAAGGVGLAAVEIGKALGATVIATAGSPEKLELARAHGADHAISYRDADWVDAVKGITAGRGVDVVFDPVGGDVFDGSNRCIAFEGRIVVIGFAGGRIPTVQANRVLLKNYAVVGLHWGAYFEHRPEVVARTHDALVALHLAGKLRPVVAMQHPLEDARVALDALAGRKTVGKVVLIP